MVLRNDNLHLVMSEICIMRIKEQKQESNNYPLEVFFTKGPTRWLFYDVSEFVKTFAWLTCLLAC